MNQLSSIDVDKASEYMAIAATLMEIKSHSLLPVMEEEELMESLRRRERAQWLEFRRKATFGAARSLDRCIFDRAEDSPQLDRLRRYAGRWPEMRRENVGLLLWGPMGTGKTFAAACVANALAERLVTVRMTTLGQVLMQMFHHPLTDEGIEKFKKDYEAVFGK